MRKRWIAVLVVLACSPANPTTAQPTPKEGYGLPPAEVVDQTGKVVGQFVQFDRHTVAGAVAGIILRVGDYAVPMQVMEDRLLTANFTRLYFTTTDCTGTAYVSDPDGLPDLHKMTGDVYAMGSGHRLFKSKGGASAGSQSIQSSWRQEPPFMGPADGPPACDPSVQTIDVIEAEELVDLSSHFTPPFSIR